MDIHEHQAKEILKKFGVPIPNGIVIFDTKEILKKIDKLKSTNFVVKAQIHAGGRGKAGGIKIANNPEELKKIAEKMFGKILVTPQTGPAGREIKRLYIEETCDIAKEFYLSCLVDRASSKIAFISSSEGGMDIEKVAKNNPEKIVTVKLNLSESINEENLKKIIKPFALSTELKRKAFSIIQAIYKVLVEKDGNLIEINPLILTKNDDLLCLDAKINFDDNALYRHSDIVSLKDSNEEDPIESEAKKHHLSYIKLNGKIGCMVNGAGLAMATMDIIKINGGDPANFLDVGGAASSETVKNGFKIILKDKNVKSILINIFGGIVRCDRVAEGVIQAVKELSLNVPVVVRLEGTNCELAKKIISDSGLEIVPADSMLDAARKVVSASKN